MASGLSSFSFPQYLMRLTSVLMVIALSSVMMSASGAKPKNDCSNYQGVEKEACEKMAGRKR